MIRRFQQSVADENLSLAAGSKDVMTFHKIKTIAYRTQDRRFQKGMSLIEVMLAISILAIVVLGTASFSFYTSGQLGLGKQYQTALQSAGQKLERLKADNEIGLDIEDGETSEELSSGDFAYTRTTMIADDGGCREVTVTVSWNRMGKNHNVSLVSLLVEK
ncbi:MAG: prepilin-type N-terminal cleavage/methylation domain-containing protein [Sedimentisphaerales bacterium]|nr:prepilin-type N-terminal cleavage/methylation domain-containing protein [Sedimentisphaerales bacterium]